MSREPAKWTGWKVAPEQCWGAEASQTQEPLATALTLFLPRSQEPFGSLALTSGFLRGIFPFASRLSSVITVPSPRGREHFSRTVLLSWQQKQQFCLLLQVTQQIKGFGKVGSTQHGLQPSGWTSYGRLNIVKD